jgi:hypothetical protein
MISGPVGRELISLQKLETLLVFFEQNGELKRFLLYRTKGIRDENFQMSSSCKVIIKAFEVFPMDELKILLQRELLFFLLTHAFILCLFPKPK